MAHGDFHHFAFSFHDEYPAFKEIIDSYDNWTFTQVLYNYMDVDRQATTSGVKYAAEKGLGVVVMEPLRGGVLSKKPPEKVAMVWEKAPRQIEPFGMGITMGLESSGDIRSFKRDVIHAAGAGKYCRRGPFRSRET